MLYPSTRSGGLQGIDLDLQFGICNHGSGSEALERLLALGVGTAEAFLLLKIQFDRLVSWAIPNSRYIFKAATLLRTAVAPSSQYVISDFKETLAEIRASFQGHSAFTRLLRDAFLREVPVKPSRQAR